MKKHAASQGTARHGDETGVGQVARIEKPIRRELKSIAKAERRQGPKPIHPAVAAAATKERLKKERAERAQEKHWDNDRKKTQATPELKGAPWGH